MSLPPTPPSPGPTASLVGRDREQAALRDALAAALVGRGSLVLIGGEAGIGKTALAEALLAAATERGALVLVGRCYDLAETPPYGPWRELFDRAPVGDGLPVLPTALLSPERDGEALVGQGAIVRRILAYLAALGATRPLVLLLEDLHWADPASLDLLRVAARNVADVPLLLLATYRADEVVPGHPLASLPPLLVREARAERLDLSPLDAAAVGALVAARYALGGTDHDRLVAYLIGRTEGNALFLGELLRTLEIAGGLRRMAGRWALGDLAGMPVPTLLRQVIAGRLGRLGEEDRRLLAVAAVLGQELSFDLWVAVGEVEEGALLATVERAIAVNALEATESGVRFTHALIREAIYAGVLAPRRRAWHQRAGEALLATPRPDPDATANHFQRAGDPRAVEWLVRAGLRARGGGASITAAARFAAAAGFLAGDASRARERGWLLLLTAQLLVFADTTAALRHLDDAEPLALLADDQPLGAHIRGRRGFALCHHPRKTRAGVAEMEHAVAAVEALPPEYRRWSADQVALARIGALLSEGERTTLPTQARALPVALNPRGGLTNWYGWTGRYREARALGEATLAVALEDDPERRDSPGRFGLALALGALGQPEEARREYALLRADFYTTNSLYVVEYSIWAELQHAVLPYQADDLPERARLAAESAQAWASVQSTVLAAPYPSQAGLSATLLEGRWAEARQLAEAGVAFATLGHAQSAGAALGALARWQGDPDAAWARVRALHPAGPTTEPGDGFFIPGLALQALAAELALDAGDLATAGDWIAAHGRWLDWSGAVLWRAEHLLLRARRAHVVGELGQASQHAEEALAQATEPRQPLALLAAHRALGEVAMAVGHYAQATNHLDAALALAAACAAPYERALTLLALVEAHRATGRAAEAQAAFAEARATFDRLGAAPALARADRLAAKVALLRQPMAPSDTLTAREVEALRLVAAGQSNREIAAALSVSERTVERHLENTYRKIAARNRAEATAYAIRHNLT